MIRKGTAVRLLNEAIEGVVVSILSPQQVELEDSHGFRRIVPVKELVEVVSDSHQMSQDVVHVPAGTAKERDLPAGNSSQGFRINDEEAVLLELSTSSATDSQSSSVVLFELINASQWNVIFEGGKFDGESHENLFNGKLSSLSYVALGDFNSSILSSIEGFYFQFLFYTDKRFENRPPQYKQVRLTLKELQLLSVGGQPIRKSLVSLGSDAALIGRLMDKFSEKVSVKADAASPSTSAKSNSRSHLVIPREKVVDLHIERLVNDPASMSSGQIIAHQLSVFEKEMDNAFLSGLTSIIFIHGHGSGLLRSSIREELKRYDGIRYGDAPSEKYGRGATQIFIK